MDPRKKRLVIVLFMVFILFGSGIVGGMFSGLGGERIDLSRQYLGTLSIQEEEAVLSTGRTLVVVGRDQNQTLVGSILEREFPPLKTRKGVVYPVHYSTRSNATGILVRNATSTIMVGTLEENNLTRSVCSSLGPISSYYPACVLVEGF